MNIQAEKETRYVEELIALTGTEINISNCKFYAEDKMIELTLTASSETILYEYIISIYEEYGIIDGFSNINKWMPLYPESNFISDNAMRVVIYYA